MTETPITKHTMQPTTNGLMLIIGVLPVLTFVAGLVAGVGVTMLVSDRPTKTTVVTVAPQPVQAQALLPSPWPMPVAVDAGTGAKDALAGARDYARLGMADAPVQIVVFADPQCPYCKKLSLETEQQVIESYVKTGKAAITYRHDVLFGDESERIALAMECAGRQGKFWEFNQHAFEHQFPENSGQATDAAMLGWAQAVQLDAAPFKACLTDPSARKGIDADMQAAQQLRIQGTPMTYINGQPLSGALPFSVLSRVIDDQLKSRSTDSTP